MQHLMEHICRHVLPGPQRPCIDLSQATQTAKTLHTHDGSAHAIPGHTQQISPCYFKAASTYINPCTALQSINVL